MKIEDLQQLESLFAAHAVSQLYIKKLAPKQDNEKNQIYLGKGLDGIGNLFPSEVIERSASESTGKRKSSPGKPKVEAKLDFFWLDDEGALHSAPHTKIIDYFQFPEIRLSGFLRDCDCAPDALRRDKQQKYGQRILALGVSGRRTIGMVITELDDPLAVDFPALPASEVCPILGVLIFRGSHLESERQREIRLQTNLDLKPKRKPRPKSAIKQQRALFDSDVSDGKAHGDSKRELTVATDLFDDFSYLSPKELLLQELGDIHRGGWHPSVRLKKGFTEPQPFKHPQGGGYTLEALLGIPPNADKAPDKYGYEIKSFAKSGKISLMTPTADSGYEGEHDFRGFMARYGLPGKAGDGRVVFSGVYRCNKPNKKTGYVLRVMGYDADKDEFSESTEKIKVVIQDDQKSELISSWSFKKLADNWNRKHASACYVQRERRKHAGETDHGNDYRYFDEVYICEGTDIWRLLRAISKGVVYYDPGHEIYAHGEVKQRPQWRISVTKKLDETLSHLYREINLTTVS